MTQHKWHKEIKAWADGKEIEFRYILEGKWTKWHPCELICATFIQTKDEYEYRIKPKKKETDKEWNRRMAEKALAIPEISDAVDRLFEAFAVKEPQYLYVYKDYGELCLLEDKIAKPAEGIKYLGKTKLEVDDV